MRYLFIFVGICFVTAAHADNDFADCLLDNLQGVQNDPAANSVIQLCLKRYPSGLAGLEKRSGWFARYASGAECTAAKAKTAGGAIAPQRIRGVCYALYEPPKPPNPFDNPNFGKLQPGAIDRFLDAPTVVAPQPDPQAQSLPATPQPVPIPAHAPPTTPQRVTKSTPGLNEWSVSNAPTTPAVTDKPRCQLKPVMTDADIALCREQSRK